MDKVIEFENISKEYSGFSIKNIDLNINKGYITGFVGANGSGKSTTIKMIMNLVKPDSGEVNIFEMNHNNDEKDIKQKIGFVYDDNIYYEGLNLRDLHKIVAPAYKNWDKKAFQHYIETFDLPLNQPIKYFSKGMRMKASLVLALSHNPELLIMDEPTAGLDPVFRKELLNILQEIMMNENKTIFFSTHITSDLEKIADYIVFIKDGEIIFNHSINSLQNEFALVKGDRSLIDRDTEDEFDYINYKGEYFEAMTQNPKVIYEVFGDEVSIDNISLEEIMYFLNGAD
ncbi:MULTISPECIES: ABC transporter ATP-binding protein [Bacillales]|uniref:Sodium ABC transporter ATP-binding protein n=2 Tax=Bacillales TaxID=1385 RepID=A0A0M2SPX4_9STAP|nr:MULTISPECIES: ABC transporter ATP-binding protein [Salinicoccus]KKK34670.1 sodium ABC transporter ATP-binding protein [Salinicoccus sediminis]SDL01936.1 ABC-2 type transport system ATP-binding protein [Salinicoccus qingdaonensis]